MNASGAASFLLTAYVNMGIYSYVVFVVVLVFYLLVVCSNVFLVAVICVNRSLHQPMYVLLCSLFVNELYGSTGLFPFLLLQILSDLHTVSASFCFLQIFCVYSYVCVEFYNLAIMAYDRYVAICQPLSYSTRMSCRRAVLLVSLAWLHSFLIIVLLIVMVAPLQLCGNTINKVYCVNYSIVKLACSDTSTNNIFGLFVTFVTVFVPLLLILFSYLRILQVCFSGSRQTRQKALSTCSPHLASLLNFSFGVCFEILQSRFDVKDVHSLVHIVLSMYFLVCPPIFSPLMYGLNMSNIRRCCRRLLLFPALTG